MIKGILISLIITTISLSTKAQIMTADRYSVGIYFENEWEWTPIEKVDGTIFINLDLKSNKIIVTGGANTTYVLSPNIVETKREKDVDGNSYISTLYRAMDGEGKTCAVSTQIYQDISIITITILYFGDAGVRYICDDI